MDDGDARENRLRQIKANQNTRRAKAEMNPKPGKHRDNQVSRTAYS